MVVSLIHLFNHLIHWHFCVMSNETDGFTFHFSNYLARSIVPVSIPRCVSRNIQNKAFVRNRSSRMTANYAAHTASNEAQLYLNSLSHEPIPTLLLMDAIYSDLMTNRANIISKVSATVLSFGVDRVVHTCGGKLDELTLRNLNFGSNPSGRPDTGFRLSLGNGSEISQIVNASGVYFDARPSILARTISEVFHVKSCQFDPSDSSFSASEHCILEPVQKWQLPLPIADMSSSSHSSWSYASLLSTSGVMFSWTPHDGVRQRSKSSVIPATAFPGSGDPAHGVMRVECSLHPQVSYVTSGSSILLYDLRSASSASVLATFDFSASGNSIHVTNPTIQSIQQHAGDSQKVAVSADRKVLMVDVRYARTPLAERHVQDTHSMLRYRSLDTNSSSGLICFFVVCC